MLKRRSQLLEYEKSMALEDDKIVLVVRAREKESI